MQHATNVRCKTAAEIDTCDKLRPETENSGYSNNELLQYWERKAASLLPPTEQGWEYRPHAGSSLCFATGREMFSQNCPFPWGIPTLATRVYMYIPNSTSIASSGFAGLTVVTNRQTNTQTTYATSVTIGRIYALRDGLIITTNTRVVFGATYSR